MKKLRGIYSQRHMLHPTVYRTVTKMSVALALSLLWDKFFNINRYFSIDYPLTIVGLIFVILAWFSYLSLDGVRFHHLLERQGRKNRKDYGIRDIVDYVDEKIISFGELEYEEQTACELVSSFLTGLLSLVFGLVTRIFGP